MTENNANKDMNKYLFINLVTMLGMSAMQQLGKLVDPAAGKAAVNLDAAQATIDTLDMLALKTQGNLDADEARIMKDTLSALKLNYVETKEMQNAECRMKNASAVAQGAMADTKRGIKNDKPQNEKPANEPKDTAAKPEPQTQEKTEPKPGSGPANDPKFHKSYT